MQGKRKTNEEFIKELKAKNPNIQPLEEYTNAVTKIKCLCLNCKHIWHDTPSHLLEGRECSECKQKLGGKPRTLTQEKFLKRINKINSNIEIISEYINVKTKIKCKCKIDGYEWYAKPHHLLNGHGCPKCGRRKISEAQKLTQDEFLFRIKNINLNILILSEYIDSNTKIKCRCLIDGHEWWVQPRSLLAGCGCPRCNSSKGEKVISQYLNISNIKYLSQYKFDDCKNKKPLPFDFYLPDYNMCIEYDGRQHYEVVDFGEKSDDKIKLKFKQQLYNDNIKNEYCQKNKIKLIRIPYWEFDNIDNILEKELRDK